MAQEEITDIDTLMAMMEEMAGAPREDGTYERQPGERCMYEIQRRESYNQELQASRMG